MSFLNLNSFVPLTLAEGPGRRFCLWTQGCLRSCPGCCNAQMQPISPKLLISSEDLCRKIKASHEKNNLEGITFLGGEPLLQAKGLAEVASFAKSIGLTVMVFTGYVYEKCLKNPLPGVLQLFQNTDVLIDGPFIKNQYDNVRNWVGSCNQRFIYLTDSYGPSIETDKKYSGIVEIRIPPGKMQINGCPKTIADFPIRSKK